jgi:pyruvate,water dikinase
MGGIMSDVLAWDAPGPGPWQQDSAHNPVAQSRLMQQVYPAGFNRGFEETFAKYGVLLDRLAMGVVNGFTYHQPQPFDLPGPDGPKDPEWIGAEIGRRAGVAAGALEGRIWRESLRMWDDELKPAAQRRHCELGSVDLGALDDAQLHAHLHECAAHVTAMVYQHHRFNADALVPVGDFLLQAAQWTHRDPVSLFAVLDGYSPVSGVSPPEMQAALAAVRVDAGARELLQSDRPPAEVIAELRTRLPEVDDYVAGVHFRVLEGFDITNPTIGERPESLVGRIRTALDVDTESSSARADAFAAEVRASTPEEHRQSFDEMLAEARLVYRLRDERGLYSDISAIGLVRLAVLELGRRLEAAGRLSAAADLLDADVNDIDAIVAGAPSPTAAELHQRAIDRVELTLAGAPRHLGPPPPAPPPLDMLPPSLARVMGAVGFTIEGILGQLDSAQGDAATIVGIPGAHGVYEGSARLVRSVDDLFELEQGEVLVAPTTGEAFNSMLHLVGAIVTDHGSFASHAAIVSREMGYPAVVGTVDGTRRISTGMRVRVDGTTGQVTILG